MKKAIFSLVSIPLILMCTRIMLYTGGDTDLIAVLIQEVDISKIVLSTFLMSFTPLTAFAIYIIFLHRSYLHDKIGLERPSLVIILLFLAFLFLSPWPSSIFLVILMIAVALFWLSLINYPFLKHFLKEESPDRERKHKIVKVFKLVFSKAAQKIIIDYSTNMNPITLIVLYSVIFAFYFILPNTMWLPLEVLDFANQQSSKGYVISIESSWVTVLDLDKNIHRYPESTLIGRTVCSDSNEMTLLRSITGAPKEKCEQN